MRKFVFILLACVSVSMMAQTDGVLYVPKTVPNPKTATANGWISDPAHYLSPQYYNAIDSICWELKRTVNVELAVVMLPSRDRENYDRFSFCQELFNYWGIGGAEKNTGVLVFFCDGPTGRRDIRIHTGGGMEGLLPDAACDDIIDVAIDTFIDGDYAKAVYIIVKNIEAQLLTDDAKSELLLGWKPQHAEEGLSMGAIYCIVSIIVLLILVFRLYKKAPIKSDVVAMKDREQLEYNMNNMQTGVGCLSFLFPIPLLFLYLYLRLKKKSIRQQPPVCSNCGSKMQLTTDEQVIEHSLNQARQTERSLRSKVFDVWQCPNCQNIETAAYKGPKSSKYSTCPACGALTAELMSVQTITAATTYRSGTGKRNYVCHNCEHKFSNTYVIPKISTSSSSSSGGGSSSRSSGGGSWGGGSSYGGGAGRSF